MITMRRLFLGGNIRMITRHVDHVLHVYMPTQDHQHNMPPEDNQHNMPPEDNQHNMCICDIAVLPHVSYNHHHTVSSRIKFNFKHTKAYQRVMLQYEQADFEGFRTRLDEIGWDKCFDSNNIDTIAQTWTDMLISVALYFIPNKVVTVGP